MTLHSSGYTPNVVTDGDYADLTNELPTANGYTAGGLLLATSWTRSDNVNKFTLSSPAAWNISGADAVAKTAVIHCSVSTAENPLVGYFLLTISGDSVTIKNGATFTVSAPASGLFTLTG